MPTTNGTFFTEKSVDEVLQALLSAFDSKVFVHAPERPNSISQEAQQQKTHNTTASGQSLTAGAFAIPPVHIPNAGDGATARHSYKSELVLVRDPAIGTKKILWWYDKDPKLTPHNHPWDFRSAVLSGGYTEERFWLDKDGKLQTEVKEYVAGDVNVVPANMFHNVISVKPGTVTFLDCGPARTGNEWGYLNTTTLAYQTFKDLTPPNFFEIFQEVNPHLRKKK